MSKYHNIPQTVEAWQIPEWTDPPCKGLHAVMLDQQWDLSSYGLLVPQAENVSDEIAEAGDWLIRNSIGEFFVLSPEVFVATYEKDKL